MLATYEYSPQKYGRTETWGSSNAWRPRAMIWQRKNNFRQWSTVNCLQVIYTEVILNYDRTSAGIDPKLIFSIHLSTRPAAVLKLFSITFCSYRSTTLVFQPKTTSSKVREYCDFQLISILHTITEERNTPTSNLDGLERVPGN